jgi:FkbM family methyltransferase
MKQAVKGLLRELGWQLGRYDPRRDPVAIRRRLLGSLGIDQVLDVGANAGQYARQLRAEGYRGRIISFEPLSSAFADLSAAARGDPDWVVRHEALGREPGRAAINVAGNSWSSSLLPMLDRHREAAPESAYVGQEDVLVRTLEAACAELLPAGARPFLKIDTQGFTLEVLAGAGRSLEQMLGVQVELSLVPLYAGEPLIGPVLTHLYDRGFTLVAIEPEFADRDGAQLQVNGLLVRQ